MVTNTTPHADIAMAVERMDILHSGKLSLLDVNKRSKGKGKFKFENYVLKNYGILKCQTSGAEYKARDVQIVADESSLTFMFESGPNQSTCFAAADGIGFRAWTRALKQGSCRTTGDAFLVYHSKRLVKGMSCSVYAGVREKDDLNIVAKAISKKNGTTIAALAETRVGIILKGIMETKYPKELVRVLDVYHTSNEAHVVMERVRGTPLEVWLEEHGCMSEAMARDVFEKILRAVEFLHKNDILHGAVCPRNIIVVNQDVTLHPGEINIKLIGFNAASWKDGNGEYDYFPQRSLFEYQRCLERDGYTYIAPESWKGHPVTKQADFWALGCTLYRMLNGRLPFYAKNLRPWRLRVQPGRGDTMREYGQEEDLNLSFAKLFPSDCEQVRHLTSNAKNILFRLLRPDQRQRMNYKSVWKHPWLTIPRFPPHSKHGPISAKPPDPSV